MKKKCVASYSGGKDSMLALYRSIKMGYEPLALITTYNSKEERSWFHGIPPSILRQVGERVGIPSYLIETGGEDYNDKFQEALAHWKAMGAEACIFGDIDIEGHLEWGSDQCEKAGIEAIFPLWHQSRESLVYEFIDAGFVTHLNVVDTTRLGEEFAGELLTRELAKKIGETGADICGEEGEYHTFVSDGPLFSNPVDFYFGEKVILNNRTCLPILEKNFYRKSN